MLMEEKKPEPNGQADLPLDVGEPETAVHDTAATPDVDDEPAAQPLSRKERRANRFDDVKREATEAHRRSLELEKRLEETQRMLEELRSQRAAPPPERREEKPDTSGDEKKLASLLEDMDYQLAIASDPNTPAEIGRKAMARYRQLEDERWELKQEIRDKKRQAAQPQVNPARQLLAAEYPWLDTNERAHNMAVATYGYLVNVEGRPPGLATEREACARTAAKLGIGGADTRTAEERGRDDKGRFTAVSSKDTGKKGAGTKVTLTADERKMAKAAGISEAALAKKIWEDEPDRRHD